MPEEDRWVVVDAGVQLAVRVFERPSAGAPDLLLHHGLASSQRVWDQMLPRLRRRARVVTYDARGHGLSRKPDRGYGFDHIVADALAVVRATRSRRPIIVGHSWGAMVALELAARHPGAIGGAVLVDGGLHRMRDEMTWLEAKRSLAPPHLDGMPLEEFRGLMRTFTADSVDLTPELEAQMLAVMRVRPDGTIAPRLARSNHFRILRAIWEQEPDELWARVQGPVLAIVAHGVDAERDEHSRRAVRRVRDLTRGRAVRIAWMRGIHDLPLQHPDALAERIERFARSAVG
ncbi:MAG: alpha/beta hydrolase [Actinomycetota bacterium]|nr:alpha/beta hydrolase [Actinomycetota bacterium]